MLDRALESSSCLCCEELTAVALDKIQGLASFILVRQCLSCSLQYLCDAALSSLAITAGGGKFRDEFVGSHAKMLFISHEWIPKSNLTHYLHLAKLSFILS